MIARRGFVGALAAMVCGWRAMLGQPEASDEQPEWGVWRDANDPTAKATVLIVDGYLLGFCCALNKEMRAVELDVVVCDEGVVSAATCDGRNVSQRLVLGDALEIHTDGKAHPNGGFRYWTGSGWANDKGESISGPEPRILREIIAGEALRPDQAVRIRNGRAYAV